MRPKHQSPVNIKFIFLALFFLLLLLIVFVVKTNLTSSQEKPSYISQTNISNSQETPECEDEQPESTKTDKVPGCPSSSIPFSIPSCNKIPPSLANALIHYATSNITPQQTFKEISVTQRVLERKSPCNFLVFGLGHDSLMWATLNHGGRTVFLEEDKSWIEQIKKKQPNLESYHVVYGTKVNQADDLLENRVREECRAVSDPRLSQCELALKGLPNDLYEVEWDLIMVDAPTGYHSEAPGRMTVIYTSGLMARNREEGETDVFVHDVDRAVEDNFSFAFLCEGYMREEEGRLRHFAIPSHRARLGRSLCP